MVWSQELHVCVPVPLTAPGRSSARLLPPLGQDHGLCPGKNHFVSLFLHSPVCPRGFIIIKGALPEAQFVSVDKALWVLQRDVRDGRRRGRHLDFKLLVACKISLASEKTLCLHGRLRTGEKMRRKALLESFFRY